MLAAAGQLVKVQKAYGSDGLVGVGRGFFSDQKSSYDDYKKRGDSARDYRKKQICFFVFHSAFSSFRFSRIFWTSGL